MKNLFLQRFLGIVTVFALFMAFVPQSAFAAYVGAPTNLSMVGGVYTNDTTPTVTWTRPSGATWYQVLVDNGTWVDLGNVDTYTLWSQPNGWHTFYVLAQNTSGDISTSAAITFEIDTVGPTVPAVSPSTATEDQSVTFSVTTSGESATSFCDLYVSGVDVGSMTKSGSAFSKAYTFTNSGNFTVYARCADGDNNYTTGSSRTVSVASAAAAETFYVPSVSPSSTTEDQATTISVVPYGNLNATACSLYVSGAFVGSMSETSSNTFTKNYTFSNSGSYTVYAYCEDENGNWTKGTSRTITVNPVTTYDTFTVPAVSPSTATEDESTTFGVSPYGTLDAIACKLYVSGSNTGSMSETSSNTFTKSYTFTNDGSYSVYAYCEDENGNWTAGSTRTVTVYQQSSSSNTLDVPTVSPSSTTEDVRTTFTVRPTSNYNVTDCWLYVGGTNVATMSEGSTNVFTATYTFNDNGSYSVYAYCKDSSAMYVVGDKRTVTVSNSTNSFDDAAKGSLIKIACGYYEDTEETCKAVYFYGNDGKRHVFPNEGVFYTWYSNFDDVVEVSDSFMASLSIGKNVTYRPGSVVVKFDSSASVYAIEADHTLHHYTTLSLLKSDYGSVWTDYLAKVPDSLFGNYTIGSDIDSTSDYDRSTAYYSVSTINDVL